MVKNRAHFCAGLEKIHVAQHALLGRLSKDAYLQVNTTMANPATEKELGNIAEHDRISYGKSQLPECWVSYPSIGWWSSPPCGEYS
jgi:hypothetical protein